MSSMSQMFGAPQRRARISMTPLIDVVFILLMFFMLTSSFIQQRIMNLETPKISVGSVQAENAILIEVGYHALRVNGDVVETDALAGHISTLLGTGPEQPFTIRVSSGVRLATMVQVLDSVTAAGGVNISLQKAEAV